MKRLLLLCALVIPCFMACEKMDEAVSPDVEQQQDPVQSYVMRVAEEGIAMLGDAETRAVRRHIDPNRIKPCITTATRSGESDTLYYVVNFADSAGFALVAADSTSPAPLLAVTEQGNYTPGEVTNTGFDDYISLLSSPRGRIDTIINTPPPTYDIEIIERYVLTIDPMIPVKWGQGPPFNQRCDTYAVNPIKKYPVGCVAVAIAQLFAYHKQPTLYTITYNTTYLNSYPNWEEINAHVICNTTFGCRIDTSIATLMREIGHRANMDYTEEGSGTSMNEARNCMFDFGYSVNQLQPLDYAVLTSELQAGRPVIMSGDRLSADNEYIGHAWVADGAKHLERIVNHYEGSVLVDSQQTTIPYIHYNWGFTGNYDGYFLYNVFALKNGIDYDIAGGAATNDYRYNVDMLTGISYNQ